MTASTKSQPAAPNDPRSELGRRIREKRLALGMTQKELAEAAGITQPGLLRIEHGGTNPMVGTLQHIAEPLGTTIRELMTGETDPDDPFHPLMARVAKIIKSCDEAAISAMKRSIEMVELLLKRSVVADHPDAPSDRDKRSYGKERGRPEKLSNKSGQAARLRKAR